MWTEEINKIKGTFWEQLEQKLIILLFQILFALLGYEIWRHIGPVISTLLRWQHALSLMTATLAIQNIGIKGQRVGLGESADT